MTEESEQMTQEPEDAEAAVTYWRERWADTASRLTDAVGVIHDLAQHANPIARDQDGFVATGYTVTVGAVHRAYAWLQGASGLPAAGRVETWQEYERWLAESWKNRSRPLTERAAMGNRAGKPSSVRERIDRPGS
jgi:hypothetical protein